VPSKRGRSEKAGELSPPEHAPGLREPLGRKEGGEGVGKGGHRATRRKFLSCLERPRKDWVKGGHNAQAVGEAFQFLNGRV